MPKLVHIANFRTKLDAEMAGGLLDGQEIPYVIQSGEGMRLGPLSPGSSLLVAPEQAEAARRILREAGLIDPEAE